MAFIDNRSKNSSIPAALVDPPRKRPVSEHKIQANRENALRSTGPRTERGKRTASRNAIKLGFYARDVVIRTGNGEESPEEFQSLLEGLHESHEPVGVKEELLVQTMANCYWGKARVLRAEAGETHKQLNTFAKDRVMQSIEEDSAGLSALESILPLAERRGGAKVSRLKRREHAMSRLYLRELLEVAKSEMDVEGHLSRDTGLRILSAFCMWDEAFACACAASSARAAETTTSTDVGDKEAIHERALLLEAIDVRLEMIRLFEKRAQERRTLEEAQSLSLPAADVIDKLIRYESHLDRQLYRAMDQLERLQRQRRGENVPPPAVVDVSVHASASSLPEALEKSADSGIANSVPALLEQPKAMSGDVDADVHADTGVVDSKPAPLGLPKAVPGSEE